MTDTSAIEIYIASAPQILAIIAFAAVAAWITKQLIEMFSK